LSKNHQKLWKSVRYPRALLRGRELEHPDADMIKASIRDDIELPRMSIIDQFIKETHHSIKE
jgi:hypothetical protein